MTSAVVGAYGRDPPSITMSAASIRTTRPSRTVRSIERSCSSSSMDTVAHRYLVGHTCGSSRKSAPRRSCSAISWSSVLDTAPACRIWPSWLSAFGIMSARLKYHASFGAIQVMSSDGTPIASRKRTASIPVLPAPTTTYR